MAMEIQITLDTRPSWHLGTSMSSGGQPSGGAHRSTGTYEGNSPLVLLVFGVGAG
jgi:hypothetical protein